MLHLNTIFEAEGLNTGKIQLIRHKDPKLQKKEGKSVFDIWYSDRRRFEVYQSFQKSKFAFAVGGFVASFVVTNTNETLFVGLYTVESRREASPNDCDWDSIFPRPFEAGNVVHELRLTDHMDDYVQRLVIEPWTDAINFAKNADKCNSKVKELKRSKKDEPFPTYMRFRRRVADLDSIFQTLERPFEGGEGHLFADFRRWAAVRRIGLWR